MGSEIEGISCRDLEVIGDCLGLEDHNTELSSDYSDSDKEVREVEDTISYHDQGEAEEAGFEGMRFLLGPQTLEMDSKSTSVDDVCRSKKNSACLVEIKEGKRELKRFP